MDTQSFTVLGSGLFGMVRRNGSTLRTVIAILTVLAVVLALFAQTAPSAWAGEAQGEQQEAVADNPEQGDQGEDPDGQEGPEGQQPPENNDEAGDPESDANNDAENGTEQGETTGEENQEEESDTPEEPSIDTFGLAVHGGPQDEGRPEGKVLIICKEDQYGNKLNGAKFKLEKKKNGGWQLIKVDKKEQFVVNGCRTLNLSEGTYRVTEVKAPSNWYEIATEVQEGDIISKHVKVWNPWKQRLEWKKKYFGSELLFINHRKPGGIIVVCKTDNEGNPLLGASFALYQKVKGEWVPVEDWASFTISELNDEDQACVTIDELEAGTYRIKETTAPDGYVIAGHSQEVTIKWTGNDYRTKPQKTVTFQNNPLPEVVIVKVDADNPEQRLNGACFLIEVFDNGDWREYDSVCTEEDGEVRVKLPFDRSYRVTETEAPSNYIRDDKAEEFWVSENNVCYPDVEVEAFPTAVAVEEEGASKDNGCTFVFENTRRVTRRGGGGSGTPTETTVEEQDEPEAGLIETEEVIEEVIDEEPPQAGPDLPRTGGSTALYYVSGLAFLGAGIWLQRKQRRAA